MKIQLVADLLGDVGSWKIKDRLWIIERGISWLGGRGAAAPKLKTMGQT